MNIIFYIRNIHKKIQFSLNHKYTGHKLLQKANYYINKYDMKMKKT